MAAVDRRYIHIMEEMSSVNHDYRHGHRYTVCALANVQNLHSFPPGIPSGRDLPSNRSLCMTTSLDDPVTRQFEVQPSEQRLPLWVLP